jgi:hypothetical protein
MNFERIRRIGRMINYDRAPLLKASAIGNGIATAYFETVFLVTGHSSEMGLQAIPATTAALALVSLAGYGIDRHVTADARAAQKAQTDAFVEHVMHEVMHNLWPDAPEQPEA